MEMELVIAASILIALVFLATVDMAFSQLSDLALRRLASDIEDDGKLKSTKLLRSVLEDRPRFRFALSSVIQILLISVTVLVTIIILRYSQDRSNVLLLALLVGLGSTVIFRQILPSLIVRNDPESVLLFLLPLVRPLYAVTSP